MILVTSVRAWRHALYDSRPKKTASTLAPIAIAKKAAWAELSNPDTVRSEIQNEIAAPTPRPRKVRVGELYAENSIVSSWSVML